MNFRSDNYVLGVLVVANKFCLYKNNQSTLSNPGPMIDPFTHLLSQAECTDL